jgi:hypothetical protein
MNMVSYKEPRRPGRRARVELEIHLLGAVDLTKYVGTRDGSQSILIIKILCLINTLPLFAAIGSLVIGIDCNSTVDVSSLANTRHVKLSVH